MNMDDVGFPICYYLAGGTAFAGGIDLSTLPQAFCQHHDMTLDEVVGFWINMQDFHVLILLKGTTESQAWS